MELKILYFSQSLSIDLVSEIERFRTEFRVFKFRNRQKVKDLFDRGETNFFEFFWDLNVGLIFFVGRGAFFDWAFVVVIAGAKLIFRLV